MTLYLLTSRPMPYAIGGIALVYQGLITLKTPPLEFVTDLFSGIFKRHLSSPYLVMCFVVHANSDGSAIILGHPQGVEFTSFARGAT
jgi:hypothetical protein